ncbi:hypothetical protein QTP88_008322 [Uroleucon formosanum]
MNNKITNKPTYLCELHFKADEIIRTYSFWNNFNVVEMNFQNCKKPKLRPNALSSVTNISVEVSPNLKCRRELIWQQNNFENVQLNSPTIIENEVPTYAFVK